MTDSTVTTHAFLVQAFFSGDMDAAPLLAGLRGMAPAGAGLHAAINDELSTIYVYMTLRQPAAMTGQAARSMESHLQTGWQGVQDRRPHHLHVSRLERVFEAAGASSAEQPAFHYVVEMDPETGWEAALFDWYDTEHMPGLARVDGCIGAARFLNHDHGPRSLACYDLVTQETLGSASWLAVRGTEWSGRMRPHFTNTIRTMFSVAG